MEKSAGQDFVPFFIFFSLSFSFRPLFSSLVLGSSRGNKTIELTVTVSLTTPPPLGCASSEG